MPKLNHALLQSIRTLEEGIKANLAIARPTAFNKMQLDELRYLAVCYDRELVRLTTNPLACRESKDALMKDVEGRANYERHEKFKPENRGL